MWTMIGAGVEFLFFCAGLTMLILSRRALRKKKAEHKQFLADADAYIKVRDDLLKSLTDHAGDFHEHGEKAWH